MCSRKSRPLMTSSLGSAQHPGHNNRFSQSLSHLEKTPRMPQSMAATYPTMHHGPGIPVEEQLQSSAACRVHSSKPASQTVPVEILSGNLYYNTVNMVIFALGKFHENVGKSFHIAVIFMMLLLFLNKAIWTLFLQRMKFSRSRQ